MARNNAGEYEKGYSTGTGTSAPAVEGKIARQQHDAHAAEGHRVSQQFWDQNMAGMPWHLIGPDHIITMFLVGIAAFAVAMVVILVHKASAATAGVYPIAAPLAASAIALWWAHSGRAEPQHRIAKTPAALCVVLFVGLAGGAELPYIPGWGIQFWLIFDVLVMTEALVASALALLGGRAPASLRLGLGVPAVLVSWWACLDLGMYSAGPDDVGPIAVLVRTIATVLLAFAATAQAGFATARFGVERSGGRTRLAAIRDVRTTWTGHLLHIAAWAPVAVLALARMQDVFRLIYGNGAGD